MNSLKTWKVGIDEAGRGSLVGEMIIGIVAVPREIIQLLRDIGVKDSKDLSPNMRRKIYETLKKDIPFVTIPVSPKTIDFENLGKATFDGIIKGLKLLTYQVDPILVESIIIDRFGKDRGIREKARLLGYINAKVTIREKADKLFPEVSLASIFAKHIRDKRIEVINKLIGLKGSGYPSDEDTVNSVYELIQKKYSEKYRKYIRLSWGTLEKFGIKPVKKTKRYKYSLEDYF